PLDCSNFGERRPRKEHDGRCCFCLKPWHDIRIWNFGYFCSLFDISCARRTCNCSGRSALQSFHVQPVKQNPKRKLSSGGLSTGTVIKNLATPNSEFRYARQTPPSASELRP